MPRKRLLLSFSFVFLFIALAFFLFSVLLVEPRYTIADLGSMQNWTKLDINNVGQVLVSTGPSNGKIDTYILEPGGGKAIIESPDERRLLAFGINHHGVVVGVLENDAGGSSLTRFLWTEEEGFSMLPDSRVNSRFRGQRSGGVNESGKVVGHGVDRDGTSHSFLWSASQGFTDISKEIGGLRNDALDINNAEEVVGWMGGSWNTARAFLWNATEGTTLLATAGRAMGNSSARALNDKGQIVGHHTRKRYLEGIVESVKRMLQTGFKYFRFDFPLAPRACLWEEGVMYDLNEFIPTGTGWELRRAHGINDAGTIAGWGLLNGERHAFMLTPAHRP